MHKNRWLIALSAIAIHLSIGSAYAYSVFSHPLADQLGWNQKQVAFAFTIAIFFLGLSAAFFGKFVERNGPRVSATVAAVCFSSGLIGSGVAVHLESMAGFYLAYGVLGGIGLGIGYISPVSTLVKWFPDRRGLATGMAVMGFGAGALLVSPIAAEMILHIGISGTFYVLGCVYVLLMLLGASYIAKPPEGWVPASMRSKQSSTGAPNRDLSQLTASEAVRTKRFWLLWIMMFVNISCGIMLISVASPMAQEKAAMSVVAASAMVGMMGLFNGAGRIGWASLSDYVGRGRTFLIFFLIQLVLFLLLPSISEPIVFQLCILAVLTVYGGGFASLPAFIGDLFGTRQLGAIHGYLLTAWSCAGIAGPMAAAAIRDATRSYDVSFYVFSVLLVVAIAASASMLTEIKRLRAS